MEGIHSGVIKAEDIVSGTISGIQQEENEGFAEVCKLIYEKKYLEAKKVLEKSYEVSETQIDMKMEPQTFFSLWAIIDMNLK